MTYAFMEGPDDEEQYGYFGRSPNRAYGCNNCHRPIQFANVLYMSKILNGESFTLYYVCDCTQYTKVLEARFEVDRKAMARLLGRLRPHLPYRAAPGPYLSLSEELENKLKVAAFDLDDVFGVDDLLLYIDGPGSNRRQAL